MKSASYVAAFTRVFTATSVIATAVWLAGCGGGNTNVALPPAGPTPAPTSPQTIPLVALIPATGGNVPLPPLGQIKPAINFAPGVASGTTISGTGSTTCPANAPTPLAVKHKTLSTKTATGNANIVVFFCETITVSQPIAGSLVTAESLSGGLPAATLFGAELDDITTTGSELQTLGGTPTSSGVTFDGLTNVASLNPGRVYLMQFMAQETGTLPVYLTNNSGIANAYYFIHGNNPTDLNDLRDYYVNQSGQLAPTEIADGTTSNNVNYFITKYTYPFPANGTPIQLPLIRSGRIYVSIGAPLVVQVNSCGGANNPCNPGGTSANGIWSAPNGWGNSVDPDYNIMFDWIEFNYLNDPGNNQPQISPNTTAVQMFGVPMHLAITNSAGVVDQQSGFQLAGGGRTTIYNAISADKYFKSLIVPGTATGTSLSPRIISADNGITNTLNNLPNVPHFDPSEWNSFVAAVWAKYATTDITMVTDAYGTWNGRVAAATGATPGPMVFTPPPTQPNASPISIAYPPDSADVIIGVGTLASQACPGPATSVSYAVCGEIGAGLSAAFNRGTLLQNPVMTRSYPPYTQCDYNDYYKPIAVNGYTPPVNLYSYLQHQNQLPVQNQRANSPNGGAYGFGYDDNCNDSSLIVEDNPKALSITVTPF